MAHLDFGLPRILARVVDRSPLPMTIAHRIAIGEYIVDARIEYCNPAAAEWYGRREVHALQSQWLSLLHHPEDMALARLLVTARHIEGPDAATTQYVSRIARKRAADPHRSEDWLPVMKKTEQVEEDGETYWITVLEEAIEPPLALQPERWAHLRRFEAQAPAFMGRQTIAEMQHIMWVLGRKSENSLPNIYQKDNISIINRLVNESSTKKREHMNSEEGLLLTPGATVLLPPSAKREHRRHNYIHWCMRCNELFFSEGENPMSCGKCKNPYWKTSASKDMRNAGQRKTEPKIEEVSTHI